MLAFLLAIMSFIVQPNGGGSTPNLAAVLAVGADGNGVDQTNIGSLTLAEGKVLDISSSGTLIKFISVANSANPLLDTPTGFLQVNDNGTDRLVPLYARGA